MSKTFDEQVKILQNNCDMSFDDAREAMIVYGYRSCTDIQTTIRLPVQLI